MTRYEIAILACKLAALAMAAMGVAAISGAIYDLLHASSLLPSGDWEWLQFGAARNLQYIPFAGLGWLAAGFYCWYNAGKLAWNMVDDDEQPVTTLGVKPDELLTLGGTVIGLFLVLPGLRTVVSGLAEVVVADVTFADRWSEVYWQSHFVGGVFEVLCGGLIIVGAPALRRFLLRLRGLDDGTADAPPSPPSPPAEESQS